MNNAIPDAVWSDDYMAQHDLAYWFIDGEVTYFRTLNTDEDKLAFRNFLVGIKLRQYDNMIWHEWYQIPSSELVPMFDDWLNGRGSVTVAGHIAFGETQRDPRCNESNYRLGPALSRHDDTIRPFEDDQFRQYVIGRKVTSGQRGDDPAFENEILSDWNRRDPTDIDRYRRIGRRWFRIVNPEPTPAPAGTDHFYDDGKPAPTVTDVAHANQQRILGPGDWRFERTIFQQPHHETIDGSSYQRILHLFVRVDDFGRVVDRMVVKVQGEDNFATIWKYVFKEYDIQALLNEAGSQHILKARAKSARYRPTPPNHLGYLYLDCAPFGSLSDLNDAAPRGKQFPEPFLWLIFRGLAEALHVQQTGLAVAPDHPSKEDSTQENHDLPKKDGWVGIVNTDIKLDNVVLNHSQPDHYPAYKTAQMIDFGIARLETHLTKDGFTRYNGEKVGPYIGFGTPGSQPPEQFNPPHEYLRDIPINTLSDTWNVGKIMFELMERRRISADTNDFVFEHDPETYTHTYSHALESLVAQCLQFFPVDRPQLNELLYKTAQGLRNWERAYENVDAEDVGVWGWKWKEEKFPVGWEVPRHWGWRRKEWIGEEESSSSSSGGDSDDMYESSSSESDDPYGEKAEKALRDMVLEQERRRLERIEKLFESSEEESDDAEESKEEGGDEKKEEDGDEEERKEEDDNEGDDDSDDDESNQDFPHDDDDDSDDNFRDENDSDSDISDGNDDSDSNDSGGNNGGDRSETYRGPQTRAAKKANIDRAVSALIEEERLNALTNARKKRRAAMKSKEKNSTSKPAKEKNESSAQTQNLPRWKGPGHEQYRHTFEVFKQRMKERREAKEEARKQAEGQADGQGPAAKMGAAKPSKERKEREEDGNSGTYGLLRRELKEKKVGKREGAEVEKVSESTRSGSEKRASGEMQGSGFRAKRRRG